MHQVADGVWLLGGFPAYAVNIYLLDSRDGGVLVDTGTRWARWRLLKELRGRPLSLVALTHCHPDHQGMAHVVCRRWRVPLACHEADVPAMEGRAPMPPPMRFGRLILPCVAGPPHPVARPLKDGDEVAGFRVVHAPGHTPGHVFFFRPADRVVLAGDVLANIHMLTGRPGLREPPRVFSSDPLRNRASMRTLLDLCPATVLFGHGPPLLDPAQLERFVNTRAGNTNATAIHG